jgi:hypothetical protein
MKAGISRTNMELEFTYTSDDFAELATARHPQEPPLANHKWRQVTFWLSALVLSIFFAVFIRRRNVANTSEPAMPTSVGGLLCVFGPVTAMIAYMIYASLRQRRSLFEKAWTDTSGFQQTQHLTVSDDGVSLGSVHSSTTWRWPTFLGWSQTNNLIVLHLPDKVSLAIPKRAVPDERQMNALLVMLASNINPPSKAFPVQPLRIAR